ncbi:MAG: hypothetical protein WCI75_18285 [candidate division NC10 bacterium]
MRRLALVFLLAAEGLTLPRPSAGATWLPWGNDETFESVQKLYDSGKYEEVVAKLSNSGIRLVSRRRRARAYELLGLSC